jgi:hypothetical protein
MSINQPPTPTQPKKKQQIDDTVYTITFGGVYLARGSGSTDSLIEKPYKITAKMTHAHVNQHGAKSTFKRFIAPKLMPLKYPDYSSLSTYHIIESSCDKPDLLAANVNVLSREGLISYIESEQLPVNVHLYDDTDALRQAIIQCNAEPEVYEKNQAALEAKQGPHLKVKDDVLRLNEDFDLDADGEISDDIKALAEKDAQTPNQKLKEKDKEDKDKLKNA